MLDIVKIILELIVKSLNPSEFSNRRKEKDLSHLGVELFLIYTKLNEILITAAEIIQSLDVYVSRMERHLSKGDDPYALTAGHWIEYKVIDQRVSLSRFGRSVKRLANELQIIDADSYRQMLRLISGKMNALDSLLKTMGSGYLPVLGPSEFDFRRLSEASDYDLRIEVKGEIQEGSISCSVEWDEGTYKKIREYLLTREPHNTLDEIKILLQQMKTVLERNFSLKDILLEVGDKRFGSDYEGSHFW